MVIEMREGDGSAWECVRICPWPHDSEQRLKEGENDNSDVFFGLYSCRPADKGGAIVAAGDGSVVFRAFDMQVNSELYHHTASQ